MTSRVGAKGQVVIPKRLRERSGMHPGAEVEFALEGARVVVALVHGSQGLGGRFQGSGMAARLIEERGREPR